MDFGIICVASVVICSKWGIILVGRCLCNSRPSWFAWSLLKSEIHLLISHFSLLLWSFTSYDFFSPFELAWIVTFVMGQLVFPLLFLAFYYHEVILMECVSFAVSWRSEMNLRAIWPIRLLWFFLVFSCIWRQLILCFIYYFDCLLRILAFSHVLLILGFSYVLGTFAHTWIHMCIW